MCVSCATISSYFCWTTRLVDTADRFDIAIFNCYEFVC